MKLNKITTLILAWFLTISFLHADTIETYKNKWKQNSLTVSGNSEWIVKKSTSYNGYTICKKNSEQQCLNIEHGSLQSSTIQNSWKSAVWDFKSAGSGYVYIQNKWKTNIYVHKQNGYTQAGEIQSSWWSAMWKRTTTSVTPTPSIPSKPSVKAHGEDKVEIQWNQVSGATHYKLYRATSSDNNYIHLGMVQNRIYYDKNLKANTTYYYKVRAGNSEGWSGYSSYARVTTGSDIVTPPPSNTTLSKTLGARYEQPICKNPTTAPTVNIEILKESEVTHNGVKSWAVEMEADVKGGSSSCTDSLGAFQTQNIFVTWKTEKGGFVDITGYSSETKYNKVRFIVPWTDKGDYEVLLYVGDNLGKEVRKTYAKSNGEDYVRKGTEIPIASNLYHVGNETPNSSTEVSWKQIRDSKKYDNVNYYELEVATNRGFNGARTINAGNNANRGACSYTVTGLTDATTAYFRVRGVNSVGRGAWSNVQSIAVKIEDKPVLVNQPKFPLMNASGISKETSFKWNCSDADNDTLEFIVSLGESSTKLSDDTGWISPSASNNLYEIGYDTFRQTKPLKPNTKYYWQVTVREKGKKADHYGGAYIKSSIWSFTTNSTGSDLAIVYGEVIGEVKPNQEVTCRDDVENLGTETARAERIQVLYKKDGKTTKFWRGSVLMKTALKAGEREILNVTIKFRDEIFVKDGESYDNVLVTGDSTVIFDFQNISEQDINSDNNRKEFKIHYDSVGTPEFTEFYLMSPSLFTNKKDFIRGIIGENLDIGYRVKDDVKVTKVVTQYRLSQSDSWETIQIDANDDDSANANFKWNIPNDKSYVTNTAEIRIRAYENATSYSEKSFVFPIYSNVLELKNITFDKNSYIVGDEVTITYDLVNDYDIKSFRVDLENPDTGERIKVLKEQYTQATQQPTGTIKFTIPDDNKYAGDKSYLNITMYDVHELKLLKEELNLYIFPPHY